MPNVMQMTKWIIFSRKKSRNYRHKIDFKMAAIISHKIEENELENKKTVDDIFRFLVTKSFFYDKQI